MKVDHHQLPVVDAEVEAHSDAFLQLLGQRIKQLGSISFAEYMQAALYEPGYGYYVAGLQKFGAQGDFITAPESSRLFGACMAEQCAEVLQALKPAPLTSVLEFGAGSGKLARDILQRLDILQCLPDQYLILEASGELQMRQRELLSGLPRELYQRVQWLQELPENIEGVILANEVLDAMPVERFVISTLESGALQTRQLRVSVDHSAPELSLIETTGEAPERLRQAIADVEQSVPGGSLPAGYQSEINLNLAPWLAGIESSLARGSVLLIDYGYTRTEYYLPERSSGTLMCYLRQHAHADPYHLPAAQDLTAHVDFSHVVEAAVAVGLELNGFCSQSAFLRCNKLVAIAESMENAPRDVRSPDAIAEESTLQRLQIASEVKSLSMPDQMGERFSVMGLSKGIDFALQGFLDEDWSHRL